MKRVSKQHLWLKTTVFKGNKGQFTTMQTAMDPEAD